MELTADQLARGLGAALAARSGGTFLAVLVYAAAGVVFIPVTLLATVTLTVFGLWPGIAIAWVGGVLSASASHALGRVIGPKMIAWLPRRIEARLRQFVARRPFSSVMLMRFSPVGNFGAFNLVAGAVGLPSRWFLVGNAVALLPGLVGLGVVINRLLAALRHPDPWNLLGTIAAVGLVVALFLLVRRRCLALPPPSPAVELSTEETHRARPHEAME